MTHLDRLKAKDKTAAQAAPGTPPGPDPDQQGLARSDLRDLLHTPGVTIAPDEMRGAVVIVLPIDVAYGITSLCPDPLQALLACQLVVDPDPDLMSDPHR